MHEVGETIEVTITREFGLGEPRRYRQLPKVFVARIQQVLKYQEMYEIEYNKKVYLLSNTDMTSKRVRQERYYD